MGLGRLDINDCNDELQVLIRSSVGGVGFLQNSLTLTSNSTTAMLGFSAYNPKTDLLWVFRNSVYLNKADYSTSSDGGYITPADGSQWLASSSEPATFDFILLKAIPLQQVTFDGTLLADYSVEFSKLSSDFMTAFIKNFEDNYKINAEVVTNGTIDVTKLTTALQADISALETHLLYSNPAHIPYGEATMSSQNVYAVTLNPAPKSYFDGMAASVKIKNDSTGVSTINFNGLGARGLKKANGVDVTNFKANGIYTVRYNASTANFILQGEGGSGTATASDLRSGKTASVDAGDIVGNVPDLNANTYIVQSYDQTISARQYINQNQTIKGYPDLIPDNIMSGKQIGNVVGTAVTTQPVNDTLLTGTPYFSIGESINKVYIVNNNDFYYTNTSNQLKRFNFVTRTTTDLGKNITGDMIGTVGSYYIIGRGVYDFNFNLVYTTPLNSGESVPAPYPGAGTTIPCYGDQLMIDPITNNVYYYVITSTSMIVYSVDMNSFTSTVCLNISKNSGRVFCVYNNMILYSIDYYTYAYNVIIRTTSSRRYSYFEIFSITLNSKKLLLCRMIDSYSGGTDLTVYSYYVYNTFDNSGINNSSGTSIQAYFGLGGIHPYIPRISYDKSKDYYGYSDMFAYVDIYGTSRYIMTNIGETYIGFTKNFVITNNGNLYRL